MVFQAYIDAQQRGDWRFVPFNASDLEGVAPVCMVLAESDPLADERMAYADRLRMAGTAVRLELYRGVTHDFIKMGCTLPEAIAAQGVIADCMKEAISG